jgi:hypothetical protein
MNLYGYNEHRARVFEGNDCGEFLRHPVEGWVICPMRRVGHNPEMACVIAADEFDKKAISSEEVAKWWRQRAAIARQKVTEPLPSP